MFGVAYILSLLLFLFDALHLSLYQSCFDFKIGIPYKHARELFYGNSDEH